MSAVEEFFVTFGSQYPREPHPTWELAHTDGWVRVVAPSYDLARAAVVAWLGRAWSNIYDDAADLGPEWFPRGELAVVTVGAQPDIIGFRDGSPIRRHPDSTPPYVVDDTRAQALRDDDRAVLAAAQKARGW